jgi:hypothetical protein
MELPVIFRMKKYDPLTEAEKEILRKEILARLEDVFFMMKERRVASMVETFSGLSIENDDLDREVIFTYSVNMKLADLMQIVGRVRRENG